jgi:hypothetical protein
MAINLKDIKAKLVESLSEQLDEIRVNNRLFLDLNSCSGLKKTEQLLPRTGPKRDELSSYISETPILDFVTEAIDKLLEKDEKFDTSSVYRPLREMSGFTDLSSTAERIITDFETLPWDYRIAFPLHNSFGKRFAKTLKTFELSEEISLATPGDDTAKNFPTKLAKPPTPAATMSLADVALALHFGSQLPDWDPSDTYMIVTVKGFLGYNTQTVPMQNAIVCLKALAGMGLALGLFHQKYSHSDAEQPLHPIIHRKIGPIQVLQLSSALPQGIQETLEGLAIDNSEGRTSDKATADFVNEKLRAISAVMSAKNRQIITAAQWFFDSHCQTDELLSFVQAAVVLEILLGEEDPNEREKISLVQLLSIAARIS